jgi:hypothetical protein
MDWNSLLGLDPERLQRLTALGYGENDYAMLLGLGGGWINCVIDEGVSRSGLKLWAWRKSGRAGEPPNGQNSSGGRRRVTNEYPAEARRPRRRTDSVSPISVNGASVASSLRPMGTQKPVSGQAARSVESSIVLPYRVKVAVTERPAAAKEGSKLIIPKIKVGGLGSDRLAEVYPDEERSQAAKDAIARGVPLADIPVDVPRHDIDPQDLQETTEFIRLILGEEPWLAAHPYFTPRDEIKERPGRPVCFRTPEDLAAWSIRHSRYNTVYYVTGVLREPLANPEKDHTDHGLWGKSGANIRAAKALKIEVDIVGSADEQRFEDHVDLYVTAEVFRQQIGIPAPTYIVQTPGGAHFYWALSRVALIEEIQTYAEALKRACEVLGFKVDGTATADRSRVLRLPHTFHWKDPNNPWEIVIFGGTRQPYELEAFRSLLLQYGSAPRTDDQSRLTQATTVRELNEHECTFIWAALNFVKADGSRLYDPEDEGAWNDIGMTLSSHGQSGWDLFEAWSRESNKWDDGKRDPRKEWERWGRTGAARRVQGQPVLTIASIFAKARAEQGWVNPDLPSPKSGGQSPPGGDEPPPGGSGGGAPPGGDEPPPSGEQPGSGGAQPSPADDGVLKDRKPLKGGIYYNLDDALALMNAHFFIETSQIPTIYRIHNDGWVRPIASEAFSLLVQHIFVLGADGKAKQAGHWWRKHEKRNEKILVLKPGGEVGPNEINLWRGFAIEPVPGTDKIRRLLRHVHRVICRRNRAKFKYLIKWLAFAVQHPDQLPEVMIVLFSEAQGTGKSTVGKVMLRIFGAKRHGFEASHKDQVLGRFNSQMEAVIFLLAEELIFAGDRQAGDQLRTRLTSENLQIEEKGIPIRTANNHIHAMMTTNHSHAIDAGKSDRRSVVFEVSEEYAQNKAWFEPLYRDLEAGGYNQFLHFLQRVYLGNWHPRELIRTEEGADQQDRSADPIGQWSLSCIALEGVVGSRGASHGELDRFYPNGELAGRLVEYCQSRRLRVPSEGEIGRAFTQLFGPRRRQRQTDVGGLLAKADGNRPFGYDVPDAEGWRHALDRKLGIIREMPKAN